MRPEVEGLAGPLLWVGGEGGLEVGQAQVGAVEERQGVPPDIPVRTLGLVPRSGVWVAQPLQGLRERWNTQDRGGEEETGSRFSGEEEKVGHLKRTLSRSADLSGGSLSRKGAEVEAKITCTQIMNG